VKVFTENIWRRLNGKYRESCNGVWRQAAIIASIKPASHRKYRKKRNSAGEKYQRKYWRSGIISPVGVSVCQY